MKTVWFPWGIMKYAENAYFQANRLNSEMMGLDSKIPCAIKLPL